MRAQRIKTGFHRIGTVGAVLCGIPALGFAVYAVFVLASQEWSDMHLRDVGFAAALGASWMLAAGVFYLLSRALGWIVAGFVGDADQISN